MEMSGMENVKGTVYIPMYDKDLNVLKKYVKTLFLLFFHPVEFFSKGVFDVKIKKAAYFIFITGFIALSLYFIIHELPTLFGSLKITEVLIFFLLLVLITPVLVLLYSIISLIYYLVLVVISSGKAEVSFRKTFNICAYSGVFLLLAPIYTRTTLAWYALTKGIIYLFPALYRYLGFSIVYKIKLWRLIIVAMIEMTLVFGSIYFHVVEQNEFLESFGPRYHTQLIFKPDMNQSEFSEKSSKETLQEISRIMEERLGKYGIHPSIEIDYGKCHLEVSYLGPKEAIGYLLDPGIFQCRIVLDVSQDKSKLVAQAGQSEILPNTSKQLWYLLSDEVALDNFDIKTARRSTDQFGSPTIAATLNKEGVAKISKVTGENLNKQMALVYNGVVISAPSIMEQITTPNIAITGRYSASEAEDLADTLRSGAYPVAITLLKETMSPQPK
jgi:hypothetical protein